ncbi:S8 family serine peptidase [Thioalkalivibrio sp. ALE11]|uniref:S8 family serine peptidase n=1 Tax=Thioalkalivibrio sp. ALE11 TaxID=1265494 RepID=UPI00039A18EF|nr:S8 family serine peptidase [Thioalkalivibrio sp. ALE11]
MFSPLRSRTVLPLILIALVGPTGCGGSSSSSDADSFELSGTIAPSALHRVDRDTNDPEATPRDNNSPARAQPLPVPSITGGFVAAPETLSRFGPAGDQWDVYSVELEAGQQALLHFPSSGSTNLDLLLLDESAKIVDTSRGTGHSERVVAPEDGEYFVAVEARRGATGYQLRLDRPWQTPSTSAMAYPSPRASESFAPGEVIVRTRADISSAGRAFDETPGPTMAGLHARTGDTSREQLWRIPEGRTDLAMSALGASPTGGPQLAHGWANRGIEARDRTLRVIQALQNHPDVVSATPNHYVTAQLRPNDPRQPDQWFHDAINLPAAWDITTGDTPDDDVIVAIVDTGLHRDHEDMAASRLLPGRSFLQQDDAGRIFPHGTHITGIIGAASNNAVGISGVSWHAKLMPVRTLDGQGRGTVYDMLQGVRYAAGLPNDSGEIPDRPADIINLSLGHEGTPSETAAELFREVRELGILTVASTGNNGTEDISLPADYPDVLAVGATDRNDRRATYSNYGAGLDLVAPGGLMTSAGDPDGIISTWSPDTYAFQQGTSMATAVVSGTLALGRAINPQLDLPGVHFLLASGKITEDLGPAGWEPETGWGRVDARKMVEELEDFSAAELPPMLSSQPSGLALGYTQSVGRLDLRNSGAGNLAIEAIDVTVEWLMIEPHRINDDGLGLYEIRVARGLLDPGRHTTRIEVTADNGEILEVPVQLHVAKTDPREDTVGRVVVELRDAEDNLVRRTTASQEDGAYHYRFDDLPEGDYRVIASTRMTGAGTTCGVSEACGTWPSIFHPADLKLDRDRHDVDFRIAWPPERPESTHLD